jgi:pilus assembly protein CpaE
LERKDITLGTILVIDDDPDVIRLVEFTLKRANYGVLTASDGESGLSIAQAQHPDLIIADVMMPKLNGYEFCRRVRAQKDLADIPILVFSARFQPVDRQTALEAGANGYLPKTVGPSDLVAHIESLLRVSPPAAKVKSGSVVAVFSLRGGVGVTSLAVNLSVSVALSREQPVALLDMTPLAGHAALMLGLRPTGSLPKALKAGEEINAEALKPHWQAHDSGVQVLSSPVAPGEASEVPAALIQPLATSLRQAFRLAVLDLPPTLSRTTAAGLAAADRVLLLVTPDLASLQSAAVALQALNTMNIEAERVWPVLNAPSGVGGLSPEAVTKALKRPLVATIPYAPGMVTALNSRRPLMLASPKSAAAGSIAQLGAQLLS